MSEFPERANNLFEEPENTKKFIFLCGYYITKILLRQKFGDVLCGQFYEYEEIPGHGVQALLNIINEKEPTDLLFPQMKKIARGLEGKKNLSEMLKFATEQGVEISDSELQIIKKTAIKNMIEDAKWDEENPQ